MKNFKKVLALVLAVVMLLSFATVASAKVVTSDWYEDADDIDYTEAVDVLGSIGVLNGFPDDTFRPDATLTRAQAAKIIAMFDNGSSSINGLYTTANVYTDCVGNWAESYIAYCTKTGIIAGYPSGKFLPDDNVTGVQYLKMVLVVLGYDAKVEGLEGTNWDVNTLALAKRVGLTASLGVKFDYSADLKRQEAAVIMLDALRAQTVVYGSALGVNGTKLQALINAYDPTTGTFSGLNISGAVYVTVAGAVQTGNLLGKDWGLEEGYTEDAFYRPYRTWELDGSVIGTYMYPVYAEYTTVYNGCDVLVDLGVAKTNISTTVTIDDLYINGYQRGQDIDLTHTLENTTLDVCDAKEDLESGAQGTLSQVFYVDGGYRITEIDTWLGKVTDAKRVSTNRDGHLTYAYNATIEVFDAANTDDNHPDFRESCFDGYASSMTFLADTALSVGEYVLVTYSCKTNAIESVEGAKAVAGTLNGYKVTNYPSQTRVDGTYIPDAVHFHLGYDESKDSDEFGSKRFFYDAYGNVIGMIDPAAGDTQYLVIDKMWVDHEDGDAVLYANVVDLSAKVSTKVVVASVAGWDADDFAKSADREYAFTNQAWYDHLRTYGLTSSNAYVISEKGVATTEGWATATTNMTFVKGDPNVYQDGTTTTEFAIDAATKFLIHEADGSYTAVTGFRSIDSMFAAYVEYVDLNNDGIAEIVYLTDVVREGSKFVAYVSSDPTTWKEVDDNGYTLYKMTVYVSGVATDVYVDSDEFATGGAFAGTFEAGFYQFQYKTLAKKNYVDVIATPSALDVNKVYVVSVLNGQILKYTEETGTTEIYKALADDVVFYSIRIDTTVQIEKADYSVMVPGSRVYLTTNGAGEIAEIYVIENIEY